MHKCTVIEEIVQFTKTKRKKYVLKRKYNKCFTLSFKRIHSDRFYCNHFENDVDPDNKNF